MINICCTPLQAAYTSPNYIKLGTFPDEPLLPGRVNSSVPSKPKSNGIMDILSSSGKTVKRVLSDGNCFSKLIILFLWDRRSPSSCEKDCCRPY